MRYVEAASGLKNFSNDEVLNKIPSHECSNVSNVIIFKIDNHGHDHSGIADTIFVVM